MRQSVSILVLMLNSMTLRKLIIDFQCSSTDLKIYQIFIKKLMHLMMQIRFDLIYAVFKLIQFISNSVLKHWIALKRVLWYFQDILRLEVSYNQSINFEIIIKSWIDSDWTKDQNNRKSIYEHLIFMNEGSISWKFIKQQSISLSALRQNMLINQQLQSI